MLYKSSKDLKISIEKTIEENKELKRQIEEFEKEKLKLLKQELKGKINTINGINIICEQVFVNNALQIKDLAYQLKGEIENLFFATAAEIESKVNLTIMISDNLVKQKGLNAGIIIREAAKEIKGSGGGQAGYASAGGSDTSGIARALKKTLEFLN
jgi:alanyl-tRNA synthetase